MTGIDDIIIHIHQQSPRIAQGVDIGGAGDQGIMIGYACNENDELVPQEYYLARQLNRYIYSKYPFDGKTQITLDDNDVRVVASFQNAPKEDLKILVKDFLLNILSIILWRCIVIPQVIGKLVLFKQMQG